MLDLGAGQGWFRAHPGVEGDKGRPGAGRGACASKAVPMTPRRKAPQHDQVMPGQLAWRRRWRRRCRRRLAGNCGVRRRCRPCRDNRSAGPENRRPPGAGPEHELPVAAGTVLGPPTAITTPSCRPPGKGEMPSRWSSPRLKTIALVASVMGRPPTNASTVARMSSGASSISLVCQKAGPFATRAKTVLPDWRRASRVFSDTGAGWRRHGWRLQARLLWSSSRAGAPGPPVQGQRQAQGERVAGDLDGFTAVDPAAQGMAPGCCRRRVRRQG